MIKIQKVLLKRVNPNNPQIKAYVKAVQKGEKIYHLMYNDESGKWFIKKMLTKKGTKVFDSKAQATAYATKAAKDEKTELIIYGKNGYIQNRRSYEKRD